VPTVKQVEASIREHNLSTGVSGLGPDPFGLGQAHELAQFRTILAPSSHPGVPRWGHGGAKSDTAPRWFHFPMDPELVPRVIEYRSVFHPLGIEPNIPEIGCQHGLAPEEGDP